MNASEKLRELAAVIVADLRETPRGITTGEFAEANGVGRRTVLLAIQWAQHHGAGIGMVGPGDGVVTGRWLLRGDVRRLPAAALARVDLLDELRAALGCGDGDDPLALVRELVERDTAAKARKWRETTPGAWEWERTAGGVRWTLTDFGSKADLVAIPEGGPPVHAGTFYDGRDRVGVMLAWADYHIARVGEAYDDAGKGDDPW